MYVLTALYFNCVLSFLTSLPLASYKAMWEYKTCDGETPLTLAAKAGFVENVRTLLEKGVWPNTTNDKGETPLLIGNCLLSLRLSKVNGSASLR